MAKKKAHATAAALLASGGQGSDPAALRKILGDKEYRKLVSTLHGQGLSVAGFTPGVPLSLQPRLKSSLAAEAKKTVGTAYAPAYQELTTAETNTKAIMAKRDADSKVYAQWVSDTNAKFAIGSAASASAMIDAQRQNHLDYIKATAQVHSLGTGNDAVLSAQREAGQGQLQAQEGRAAIAGAQQTGTAALIGSLGTQAVAANAQKAQSEGAAALKSIGDSRLKLKTEEGAKVSEVLTGLQNNEIGKAETQQSNAAASEALNIKTGLEKLKLTTASQQKQLDRESRESIASERVSATREATAATTQAKRDSFLAKYGVTPEAFRRATPAKRLQYLQKAAKASAKPGAGAKPLTAEQLKQRRVRDDKTIGSIKQADSGFKSGGYFSPGDTVADFQAAITSPAAQGGLGITDPVIVRYLIEKYHNHKVSAKTRKALQDKLGDPKRLAELGL